MSLIEAVRRNRPFLLHGAIMTIQQCMDELYNLVQKPHEPDYIAKFVVDGPELLGKYWSPVLSRYHVALDITGVYCHQKPKIRFDGMKRESIEIGDMLWCHFHTFKDGSQTRTAILYQAKVATKMISGFLRKNEQDQFMLYSEWPQFKYVKSPPFSGTRHVIPNKPRRGGEYLLIDNKARFPAPFHPCMPYLPLIPSRQLCCELVDSLEFAAGDLFDDKAAATAPSRKDWSTVIWDLLDNSLSCTFTRNRAGYSSRPRNNTFSSTSDEPTELMTMILGARAEGWANDQQNGGREGHGIPLMTIETKDARQG